MTRRARERTASGPAARQPLTLTALVVLAATAAALLSLWAASPANAAGTPPVAPTIDSFNANYTSVALFVTQPAPPGQSAVTSYEYSIDAGAHWGPVVRVASPLAVVNLSPGTAYSMILRAQSADGPGAASAPISFTTRAFTEPDAVLAVHPIVSATQVLVTASKPGDGGSPITGYQYSLDGGAWAPVTIQSENAKTLLFHLLPLPEVGDHTIAMRAANAVGSGLPSSPVAFALVGPTGLVATPGDAAAAISFTAPPPDNGDPVVNYEYSIDGGPFTPHVPPVTTSPLVVEGLTNGVLSAVQLRAVYATAGPGAASAPVRVTPQAVAPGDPGGVPKAPVLVRAVPGDASITVTFRTPTDAEPVTNYEVSLDDGASGAPLTPAQTGTIIGGTGDSVIVLRGLGITNGTTYKVRLVAMNDLGESTPSNSLTVTPQAPPDAPTNLVANAGDRKAVVSFTPGAAPAGAPILGYEASVNNGTWRSAGAASPIVVTNLANGFGYSIRVRAVNVIGPGAESAPVSVFLPGPPTAPSKIAAIPGDGSAEVAITPGPDGVVPGSGPGLPILNYEYSLNGGATPITRTPASAVSPLIITGLANGTEVSIMVRAVNLMGPGPWSAAVKVTPGVPSAPTISGFTASPGQLAVTFVEGRSALVPTDHQYSLDGGKTWNAFRTPQTSSPLQIGGLTDGVRVDVALRAMFGGTPGLPSTPVAATPGSPPGGIPGLTATAGDACADIAFTPPAGVITRYEYSLDGGSTFAGAAVTSPGHVQITGLTNGVGVRVSLRAVNDSGPGPWSAPVSVTPGSVPAPPTGLVATPGAGQVSIAFTPGSDGGSPITGYEYRAVGVGARWLPVSSGGAASPVTITGLSDWRTYTIELRAVNALGAGFESSGVDVTPAPVGSVFVPVAPARVIDTRTQSGGAGPVLPGDAGMRTFSVAAAQAGGAPVVPAGATAVLYNLTVPNPLGTGHIRIMPGDAPLVSVSAINFRTGETIANGLTSKIDAQRQIKVYTSAPTDIIVDILGYFVPTGQAQPDPPGGRFTPMTPVRVYEAALDPSGLLAAGQSKLVSVTTTQDGLTPVVPVDASAVAYNLTVIDPSSPGHLRVMPGDVPSSSASAINWATRGDRVANGLTVKLDASGQMRVYNAASAPVRFLIDVVGYYSNSGKLFYPIVQARVSDSRPEAGGAGPIGFGPANQRLVDVSKVQRSGEVVVPDGASAIAYNLTVVNPREAGHLRLYPADARLVDASALNWPAPGLIRANGSVGGISPSRQVLVYNGSSSADALVDVLGFYK